nr:unnamed protein product [Digitaria exilis]
MVPPDAAAHRKKRWDGLCACLKRSSAASTSSSESGGESADSAASRFASAPAATTSAMAAHTRATSSGELDAAAAASCSNEPLSLSSSPEAIEVERHLAAGKPKSASATQNACGARRGEPGRARDLANSGRIAQLGNWATPAPRWMPAPEELEVRYGGGTGGER